MDNNAESVMYQNEELKDLLDDVQTRLDELRHEFNDALDDLQDMIAER